MHNSCENLASCKIILAVFNLFGASLVMLKFITLLATTLLLFWFQHDIKSSTDPLCMHK